MHHVRRVLLRTVTDRRAARAPVPAGAGLGALLLAALAIGALPLAAPSAVAAPARASPAAPPAAASGAPRWGWPLDAAAGAPRVLRRADLPARPWEPGHRGVDLAADPGEAVLAPVDGVVVAAGRVAGRGVVSVRAASGWSATLEPVEAAVRVGERVRRGQVVGALSAGTGHCGPAACLHWGVRSGSGAGVRYRDPLSLLRRRVVLLPVPGW